MHIMTQIMTKNETFPLSQKLRYANYGICTCVICHQFVSQKVNKIL